MAMHIGGGGMNSFYKIQAEISDGIRYPHGKAKDHKSFVCRADLKAIWTDSRLDEVINNFFTHREINHHERARLRRQLSDRIAILSCLLHKSDVAMIGRVKAFIDRGLLDSHLPLRGEGLRVLAIDHERDNFSARQYIFCPYIIRIRAGVDTIVIEDEHYRLPFVSVDKAVGSGGYGVVDKVGIAKRHFKQANGSDFSDVHYVACKKIKYQNKEAYLREVKNNKTLLESISSHDNIMTHIVSIVQGKTQMILMPLARGGDLDQFLYQRTFTNDRPQEYMYKNFFPQKDPQELINPMLVQLSQIAHALNWLHAGIFLKDGSGEVHCAHMDLKPSNILIDLEDGYVVGRWKISDFGISVTHSPNDGKSKTQTIGNIYERSTRGTTRGDGTLNYTGRQDNGAYQAPDAHIEGDQKGTGRRSDVWSFGCIACEVLAFLCGGADEVINLFNQRKTLQPGGISYYMFYEEVYKYDQGLSARPTKSYRLASPVNRWLDSISNRQLSTHRWVPCFVAILREILVPRDDRPSSKKLLSHMIHAVEHADVGLSVLDYTCGMLKTTTKQVPPPGNPRVTLSVPDGREVLLGSDGYQDQAEEHQLYPEVGPDADRSRQHRENAQDDTQPWLREFYGPRQPVLNSPPSSPSQRASGASSPTPLETGNTAFPSLPVNGTPSIKNEDLSIYSPRLTILQAIATNNLGDKTCLAWLTSECIHIFTVNLERFEHRKSYTVTLPLADCWQHLELAGSLVVAWGFSAYERKRMLFIADYQNPLSSIELPPECNIEIVSKVTLSRLGIIALLCNTHICVVDLGQRQILANLRRKTDQAFTDIAFNDRGTHLFAWIYSSNTASLHIWRYNKEAIVGQEMFLETISNYTGLLTVYKPRRDQPKATRILPYGASLGSIVAMADGRFFAADVRRLSSQDNLPRPEGRVFSDYDAVRLYQDQAILVLTKKLLRSGWKDRSLLQYKVDVHNPHTLLKATRVVKKFRSTASNDCYLHYIQEARRTIVLVYGANLQVDWLIFNAEP